MLGFCQREEVGIAGARLLYADDTIQHAGVVIGFGGIAGHTLSVFTKRKTVISTVQCVPRITVLLQLPAL